MTGEAEAARAELVAVDGIGGVVADAVIAFFADPHNRAALARLLGEVTPQAAAAPAAASSPVAGRTVVFTGKLERMSRDEAKARRLLDDLTGTGEHYTAPLAHFAGATDFAFDDREQCLDLVVNASPLGMRGQPPLVFDWSHAPPRSIAYDIVTDPVDTPFLQAARARGLATVTGVSMLIGQAAAAFEKFFATGPPRDADGDLMESLRR
jgi:shikimate dehydrogenase